MIRISVLAVIALVAACERPSSEPEGGRSLSSSDSALKSTPGYVVDSALPREEALRRFRVGIDSAPTRLGGAPSREALVKQFFLALEKRDSSKLRSLAISKAEFAYLLFPDSRMSRPPYNQPPDIAWMMLKNASNTGFSRLLQRVGGGQVRYIQHSCPEPETDGAQRFYRHCSVRIFANGEYVNRKLFGDIVERDGRYKFLGFDSDY